MGSILAFLQSLYGHKEKIILAILVLAFIGVGYQQYKLKKNIQTITSDSKPGENPNNSWKPSPLRKAASFGFRSLQNPYPVDTYQKLASRRNIWEKPQKQTTEKDEEKVAEWASIKVRSVFDPTQSGSYIAIIEVDKRSRIVKEGQQFGDYEVQRVDGVRSCLTIRMKALQEEREFCKEE